MYSYHTAIDTELSRIKMLNLLYIWCNIYPAPQNLAEEYPYVAETDLTV